MLLAHRYKSCYCLLLGCSHISITYLLTTVSSTWLWLCIIKVDWLIVNMIDQLLLDQLLMLRTYHRLPVHKLSVIYQPKKWRIIIIKSVLYTYYEGWVREGGWINLCNTVAGHELLIALNAFCCLLEPISADFTTSLVSHRPSASIVCLSTQI